MTKRDNVSCRSLLDLLLLATFMKPCNSKFSKRISSFNDLPSSKVAVSGGPESRSNRSSSVDDRIVAMPTDAALLSSHDDHARTHSRRRRRRPTVVALDVCKPRLKKWIGNIARNSETQKNIILEKFCIL